MHIRKIICFCLVCTIVFLLGCNHIYVSSSATVEIGYIDDSLSDTREKNDFTEVYTAANLPDGVFIMDGESFYPLHLYDEHSNEIHRISGKNESQGDYYFCYLNSYFDLNNLPVLPRDTVFAIKESRSSIGDEHRFARLNTQENSYALNCVTRDFANAELKLETWVLSYPGFNDANAYTSMVVTSGEITSSIEITDRYENVNREFCLLLCDDINTKVDFELEKGTTKKVVYTATPNIWIYGTSKIINEVAPYNKTDMGYYIFTFPHEIEGGIYFIGGIPFQIEGPKENQPIAPIFIPTPIIDRDSWYLQLVNVENQLPQDYSMDVSLLNTLTTESNYYYFDARITDELSRMIADCNAQIEGTLSISSGYRSWERQDELHSLQIDYYMGQGYEKEMAITLAWNEHPPAGYSEHQIGLSVDFITNVTQTPSNAFNSTVEYSWLIENSANYGFILRYPAEKIQFTGVEDKPYHFRYVGQEAAQYMANTNICLEEYLSLANKED